MTPPKFSSKRKNRPGKLNGAELFVWPLACKDRSRGRKWRCRHKARRRQHQACVARRGYLPGNRDWDRVTGVALAQYPVGLAYGEAGNGRIPGKATLVFEVELIDIR